MVKKQTFVVVVGILYSKKNSKKKNFTVDLITSANSHEVLT